MKTHRFLLLIPAAALAVSVRAQSPTPPAPAPAANAESAVAAPVAGPVHFVYSPRLPAVTELTAAAAAQHLTIARIEQTATQVTVVYLAAGGATNTVVYQLLPPADSATNVAAAPPGVYQAPPGVVYYDDYGPGYYYAPFGWYPPVSVQLGFGFRGGGFRRWR